MELNGQLLERSRHMRASVLQITRRTSEEEVNSDTEQLEVILGLRLNHPNVVKTLASGSKTIPVSHCTGFIAGLHFKQASWFHHDA